MKVVAFAYMVGQGAADHNYTGPPELLIPPENPFAPAELAIVETLASDVLAGTAVVLAIMHLNMAAEDLDYTDKCLIHAKALYAFVRADIATDFIPQLGYSVGALWLIFS